MVLVNESGRLIIFWLICCSDHAYESLSPVRTREKKASEEKEVQRGVYAPRRMIFRGSPTGKREVYVRGPVEFCWQL